MQAPPPVPVQQETGPFSVGERVLVAHTVFQGVFEAKVLKAEFKQGDIPGHPPQWHYFLHYNGWNKKHDDWQPQSNLSKISAAGGAEMALKPRKMQQSKFGKKKMGGDFALGQESIFSGPTLQLELEIPPLLKKALIEDYDAIVSDAKLAPLPRSPTVIEVLKKYEAYALEQQVSHSDSLDNKSAIAEMEELTHGIRSYFDKALMAILLYRSERAQALQHLTDGRTPSAVYGVEHLLRLFVKLPDLLPTLGMSEIQLQQLATKLQDFMSWVAVNSETLILPKDKYLEIEPLAV